MAAIPGVAEPSRAGRQVQGGTMAVYQTGGRVVRRSRLWRWAQTAMVAACVAGYGQMAAAADPQQGRKLYKTHCENCHGTSGAGQIPGAPDFLRGDTLMRPDIELMRTVKAGRGMMPAYQGMFTEPELLDVIAYLRTLRLHQ